MAALCNGYLNALSSVRRALKVMAKIQFISKLRNYHKLILDSDRQILIHIATRQKVRLTTLGQEYIRVQ